MIDILWNFFELSVNVWESAVFMFFVFQFLNTPPFQKENRKKYLLGWFLHFTLVTIMNHLTVYEGLACFVYAVFVFVFSHLLLNGSWLKKLMVSVLPLACVILISSTVTNAVSVLAGVPLEMIYSTPNIERFLAIVCVQLLLVYCFQIILKLFQKNGVHFQKAEWLVIISVLILSFLVMVFLHLLGMNATLTTEQAQFLVWADTGIIAMNLLLFYLVNRVNQNNRKIRKMEQEQQLLLYQNNYAESIQQQADALQRMRHDWKQHLSVVQMMLSENEVERAKNYLHSYQNREIPLNLHVRSSNPYLDALLHVKFTVAREYGIQVDLNCQAEFDGYSDVELCNLVGNLMDNAIEACQEIPEHMRRIRLTIHGNAERLMIETANTVKAPVTMQNPHMKTNKKDGVKHGYGLKTIRSIVRHYHGDLDYYDEDGLFHMQVVLYGS